MRDLLDRPAGNLAASATLLYSMRGEETRTARSTDGAAGRTEQPLRVLHCLWSGGIGGMERAVYQLVRSQMDDPDLEPALLFARGDGLYFDRAGQLGCPVIDLALPHGHAVTRLPAIRQAMRGFDVIHFHSVEPLLMLASQRLPGIRRMYTHRGGPLPPGSGKRRLEYGLAGLLMRQSFEGLSANTRHAADCAGPLFRLGDSAFQVTYNGIDFSLLDPQRSPSTVRRELGVGEGDVLVGTSAHLRDWKRIDRLLEAFRKVGGPDSRVVVAGEGPDRARLEQLTNRLGLADRVRFLGWYAEMGDLLQTLDVFVLPSSNRESFGNSAVEALAMGLPTIVFADGGGLVEHVEDGETGFVVDDQAGLERALARLLGDSSARTKMGARARQTIRGRYSLGRSAAAYRQLYGIAA